MGLVDCEWGEWKHGDCSEPCGGGVRINSRVKWAQEENGGTCEGTAMEEEPCNEQNCPGKYHIGIFTCLSE